MLKDLAEKYYQEGYNCAESIIRAANEYYDMGLSEDALKMVAGFGGGMQVGDVCGALTGATCVLSSQVVETKAHETPDLHPKMVKLVHAFNDHFGARQCSKIKPTKFDKQARCQFTVSEAAEVLEKVLAE